VALTPKERLFAREYLRDLNATRAAIRAGYSKASAASIGSENLQKPDVRDLIDTAIEQRELRVEVKADDVLRELRAMASVDVREAYDENGALLPLHEMSPDVRKMIASVEAEEIFAGRGEERTVVGTLRKVKFWPKDKALELLGRHLRMFVDRVEHGIDKNLEQIITEARALKAAEPAPPKPEPTDGEA
jgi:phage terminase small subunit